MKLDLARFQALIRQRCGLYLEGNNETRLAAALVERIAATACGDGDGYYSRLCASEAEFQALVNRLTINETYFFREAEQLRLLAERLAPRLLERRGQGPLRILSAGCSSGEEPYSILMALHERYGESVSGLFSVTGGDIDTQVLAKARAGRYTEFSFRGVSPEIRARYFERLHDDHVLKDALRKQVIFHEFNLLATDHPPTLHGFDIIFFRNVSIYFDTPARRAIQQNLAALLKDDGCLVTGSAETLANDLGVLTLVEEDGLFYFAKGNPPQAVAHSAPLFDFTPVAAPQAPLWPPAGFGAPSGDARTAPLFPEALPPAMLRPVRADAAGEAPASLESARLLVAEKRHDAALEELQRLLHREPGNSAALLLKAHILLNRKEFAEACQAAQQVLASDPWSIDSFVVLGLAAKWREQSGEAVRWFKQAVYARHECWPARYYLAELYRAGGEAEKARREYRGVQQSLSQAATPDTGIRVVPLGLPMAEVRFLCEHQLARLGDGGAAMRK
jgi:chemotaxis protein methyltransferase CheR